MSHSNAKSFFAVHTAWLFSLACMTAWGVTRPGPAHMPAARPPAHLRASAACPWLNPHLPIARRVAMLMRKMSLADELNMVAGHGMRPYVGNISPIPALCIPALTLEDGPNGVGDGLTGVTQLPSGASLAASFSRRLAFKYGQVIGAEQAAKGSDVDLGPTVNILRDPRWGREFESLSEDPFLAANIDVAEIRGIQSQGTIAQVKHFAAYNQETNRNTPLDQVTVSLRALHEIYFPAFRAAVRKAHVGSLMCSYATVNGEYSCQNPFLLTRVLRREWNFDGFVTSDWSAVHSVSAAPAGTDMEQPMNTFLGPKLRHAVTSGAIPRAVLNTMVARILTQMFRFHLFSRRRTGSVTARVTTPAHQALSTQVAEAGVVLLKNQGHLLPLRASANIAVIGPAASAQVTYGGGGSAHVIPSSTISPLAGIEAVAGRARVTYTQGLPTDAQLTPIPAADLSAPPAGQKLGGPVTVTLTPPATGTYIIGFSNNCHCYSNASLALDGKLLLNNPGTPPVTTYSVAVHLNRGQAYQLTIFRTNPIPPQMLKKIKKLLAAGGKQARAIRKMMRAASPAASLTWATPATLRSDLRQAVQAAKSAKVAVVVVADDTETEGADRAGLHLPSAQDALISAVAGANPHTVVVVEAGAPVVMPWRAKVSSLLDAWYPGQTNGTVLANVLFGKFDPSGHLPVTFPRHLANVPAASAARFPGINGKVHYSEGIMVGYRWYDARHIQPLFPFGFGLSYTHFRFSGLRLSRKVVDGVTPLQVSARITNAGHVAGADVVQLYLGLPAATGEPPRQLVGFQRVALAPGQSKVVHFTVQPRDEWWWRNTGWSENAGTYHLYLGDSSALANLPLTASYQMKQAIGGREVTIASQKVFQPGVRTVVNVSLGAGGNETLHGVHLTLRAPGGWRVVPMGSVARATITPSQGFTAQFAVTPPAGAVSQYVTLYGTAVLSSHARRHAGETAQLGS